jgi:hypothetical protein
MMGSAWAMFWRRSAALTSAARCLEVQHPVSITSSAAGAANPLQGTRTTSSVSCRRRELIIGIQAPPLLVAYVGLRSQVSASSKNSEVQRIDPSRCRVQGDGNMKADFMLRSAREPHVTLLALAFRSGPMARIGERHRGWQGGTRWLAIDQDPRGALGKDVENSLRPSLSAGN